MKLLYAVALTCLLFFSRAIADEGELKIVKSWPQDDGSTLVMVSTSLIIKAPPQAEEASKPEPHAFNGAIFVDGHPSDKRHELYTLLHVDRNGVSTIVWKRTFVGFDDEIVWRNFRIIRAAIVNNTAYVLHAGYSNLTLEYRRLDSTQYAHQSSSQNVVIELSNIQTDKLGEISFGIIDHQIFVTANNIDFGRKIWLIKDDKAVEFVPAPPAK